MRSRASSREQDGTLLLIRSIMARGMISPNQDEKKKIRDVESVRERKQSSEIVRNAITLANGGWRSPPLRNRESFRIEAFPEGSNFQLEAMVGRPVQQDRVCGFDGDGPAPYQLDHHILRAQDRQRVLPERCFLQSSLYCARVVDRQGATAVESNRDSGTLAGAQPPLRGEAQKHFQFGQIIDALLQKLRRIQGCGVSRLLVRIGASDLGRDVIGRDER